MSLKKKRLHMQMGGNVTIVPESEGRAKTLRDAKNYENTPAPTVAASVTPAVRLPNPQSASAAPTLADPSNADARDLRMGADYMNTRARADELNAKARYPDGTERVAFNKGGIVKAKGKGVRGMC